LTVEFVNRGGFHAVQEIAYRDACIEIGCRAVTSFSKMGCVVRKCGFGEGRPVL